MAYSAEALQQLNADFVTYANQLLPADFDSLTRILKDVFEISTLRNVRAWFGRESFSRNFLSAKTPRGQKDDRILIAQALMGRLQNNRPERTKDYFLHPKGGQNSMKKFKQYFKDDYIKQNLAYLEIDGEKLSLSYATESDPETFTSGSFDLSHPMFDEFRSGEEEE